MNRPVHGSQNPTPVDHATDTYDTIDWLVKNVPESNGKSRHPRDLVQRLHVGDGALRAAPRAQGGGADQPDGRRLAGRRLVSQRRLPPDDAFVHLRSGGHAQVDGEVVDERVRRLRHVPRGGIGRRARAPARARAARLLEQDRRAPELRHVLARSGGRPGPRRTALEGAGDARAQPVGSGGHLRGAGDLPGAFAERRASRQGLSRDGAVAPRRVARRRQHARGDPLRQRHRAHLPSRHPASRSSTST